MKRVLFGILALFIQLSIGYPTDHAERNPEQGDAFEGDIVLTPQQLEHMQNYKSGIDTKFKHNYWTTKIVPYAFHESLVISDDSKAKVLGAMKLIMDKTDNCVKFVEHTNEPNYVVIQHDKELCQSKLGKVPDPGPQPIWIQPGCSLGNIAHELLHTLGFSHEQSRYDRDDYVRINFENIIPKSRHNFDMDDAGLFNFYGVPYDYDSILHYGSNFFGIKDADGSDMETITVRQAGAKIGQRSHLSAGDIQKVKNMYGCK